MLVSIVYAFILKVAFAAEVQETFRNVRSMGMGGVYLGLVDDAEVLFYNPASLGRVKGFNWTMANVGLGTNVAQWYNDFKDMKDASNINGLSNFYGKNVNLGLGAKSAIAFPYFGFGAYDSASALLRLHNPPYPYLDAGYYNDLGFVIGGALPVGPLGAIGLNLKRITRTGGNARIGISTLVSYNSEDLVNQLDQSGTGYGADLGLMLNPPLPLNPTFSVVWQDVGCTEFLKSSATKPAPNRIRDNISLGMGAQWESWLLGFAAGVEYRHLNDSSIQTGKKVHMGLEVSVLNFDFRAGFSQGYVSYGVGTHLWLLDVDLASYTEELGEYPGQTPDSRIVASVGLSMKFDPDFSFLGMGGNGSKRRLKVRR